VKLNLRSSSLVSSSATAPAASSREHDGEWKIILRRNITWLVLVSYTLLMFRPVMPVVMDKLAHTFWEQQHMLVVHEVNGKFHVHNELVKATHQSEKDKQSVAGKYQVEECITVAAPALPVAGAAEVCKNKYPVLKCFYSFCAADLEVPPPRLF